MRVDGEPVAQARAEGEALEVTGNLVVHEVVERLPLERELLLAIVAGEAGELPGADRAGSDHRADGEDRPVADAGGAVTGRAGAGADRVRTRGVLREEVEAAPG